MGGGRQAWPRPVTSRVTAVAGPDLSGEWRGPVAGAVIRRLLPSFTSSHNEPYSVQAVIELRWGNAGINMIINVGVQRYREIEHDNTEF